jgi:predicted acyl esterase
VEVKRVVLASAIAVLAGPATAWAVPPRTAATFPGIARTAAAPAPAVPTFVNGMAQAVFPTTSAGWVNHDLWVELDVDSDGDGLRDRVHADVSRPTETDSDGLKVPVIFEDSPYYAGGADVVNWSVDHELGVPPATRIRAPLIAGRPHTPQISTAHENPWVSRGFAVMHAESPGTGSSTGCPNSGAPIETLGATAVIDWLNGRRKGYTTKTGTTEVTAYWHNGNSAMMGTSYNGTLPIAAASTGVEGLKAIVPISAISDWYDYYRANGMTRAPGGFQGEDLDVLSEYIYSRNDDPQRTICWPAIQDVAVKQDRASGDRSAFWEERNYMKDVRAGKLKAATLIAHGNGDNNVMTKNAVQLYDELKKQGVPRQFYFHQGGHGGAPPDFLLNLWFSKYLYNQDNGVENLPKSWVVREATACPPRQSTVVGAVSASTTMTVASAAPFRVGYTLTIPQATGSTTRVITNIAGNVLTLASAVTAADGAVVSAACSTANPTPYVEWPDPATGDTVLRLGAGGGARGVLGVGPAGTSQEKLIDDAGVSATTLMNAASEDSRLLYVSNPLTQDVRISGTPRVSLNVAFSAAKANLTAVLVSLPATGNGTIITRGWKDPQNRTSDFVSEPMTPGTFYKLDFDMQPRDVVVAAGRRIGLMVLSSDRDYTIRPAPGTELTLDLAGSTFTLPTVGGSKVLTTALGGDAEDAPVGGTVPATLALTLGAPATFGAFTPGVAKEYTATSTATVVSTAGDATLSVSDPGHLMNGTFALPQPLQVAFSKSSWSAPASNEAVTITFKQAIGAGDALRTGTYSRTLTFTLSTTTP